MIDETIEEIREMQTHSSSVVAIKATRALLELLDREFATVDEFERGLEHNAGALRRANPSHASLHNAMRDVVEGVVGESDTVEGAKEHTRQTIEDVVSEFEAAKRKTAENAAATFEDGQTFLTHDFSTTVIETIEHAVAGGAELTAYVTEARPRYHGRKTARTLATIDGVSPHLVVDGAAGLFLQESDRVLVGMDCIVDGTMYNRVGTFTIIAVADELGVPVTAVGSSHKIVEDGFRFENQHRPTSEVMLEPIEDVRIENPAYDSTPLDLVDEVITEDGVAQF